MELLTLIRNIAGNIALFFLVAAFLYYIVYHLMIRTTILGWDLYKWRLIGADQAKLKEMGWKRVTIGKLRIFRSCWNDCIGYDGSTTWSRGGKRWEGYGTGR